MTGRDLTDDDYVLEFAHMFPTKPVQPPPVQPPPREDETVQLWAGPRVAVEALRFAVELEFRGCTTPDDPSCQFRVDGDQLVVTPPPTWTLSESDRAMIRTWKADLIAIVQYPGPCSTV